MTNRKKDDFIEIMKSIFPNDNIIVHSKNLFKNRNPFITEEEHIVEKNMDAVMSLIDKELDEIQEEFLQFQENISHLVLCSYFKHAIKAFEKEAHVIESSVQNRNAQNSYDEMLSKSYKISEYELRKRIFKSILKKYS